MRNQDIKTLTKILLYKKREDLAGLLDGCLSEIYSWGQYGSRHNSILSKFIIYAPIQKFYELKKLNNTDKILIFDCILEVYPVVENEPEIKSFDVRILKEGELKNLLEVQTFIGRSVRVFISYSTKDAKLAGGIKRGLEQLGMDVFIAHEDITPSAEWVETILENLKSTDVFMPIITEEFLESDWTDQESGIAFAGEKIIIPVSVKNHQPYGFISRFQSAKIQEYKNNESIPYIIPCDDIVEAMIKTHPKFGDQIFDSLLKAFKESHNYDNAGSLSKLLTLYETLDKNAVMQIFNAAIENNQIYSSRTARPHLETLFQKYNKFLDTSLTDKLVDEMGDNFKLPES